MRISEIGLKLPILEYSSIFSLKRPQIVLTSMMKAVFAISCNNSFRIHSNSNFDSRDLSDETVLSICFSSNYF